MRIYKVFVGVGITLALAVSVLGVNAQQTQQFRVGGGQENRQGPPIVVTIDANGRILVRGTLVSSSGTTLTVKSWGMQFAVDASHAQIAGAATNTTAFAIGDIIGVQGMLDANNPGMIAATTVRDWGSSQAIGMKPKQDNENSSTPRFLGGFIPNPQGDSSSSNASGTQGLGQPRLIPPFVPNPDASGTQGFVPPRLIPPFVPNPGASGTQSGIQDQLQSLFDQLNQIRSRLPGQQTLPRQ